MRLWRTAASVLESGGRFLRAGDVTVRVLKSRSACPRGGGSAAACSPSTCRRPGPGACGRTTSAYPASTIARNAARSGGETCVEWAKTAMSQTSSFSGAMFQSPTSATWAAGSSASQPAAVVRERLEPLELVLVVRVGQRAAVGHVEAPHPDAAAGRAQRPGLGRRVQALSTPRTACRGSRPRRPRCPTRDRIATPFHCEWPTCATS